ncbi:hypothetical protein BT96DRAFT_1084397 [Gymnopus androsaceus JB14]|uniref:60S ribosomal protein L3 n=1 Tax=Gymnopus androsaceus JB14 TaxID=1447944 RepID=A0A6A4GLE4_9AGAR|nr:hypothetical protein BT96DRAFT_1084397 [Gymnopus androsaceus JB14]
MYHRHNELERHGAWLPIHRNRRACFTTLPLTKSYELPDGTTHVIHKREIVEAVTVIETLPMMVVGVVGYVKTPRGLRTLTTKAFTCYAKKHVEDGGKSVARELERIRKYCTVVRVLTHTQIRKTGHSQMKTHLMEIQVNGGSIPDKVEFTHGLFEKPVEGHGFESVTHRWGTKKLLRKTHKGLRKVACIGARHPSMVMFSVARAGQNGYHHRTEINKKVYRIGSSSDDANATTESDVTKKQNMPMGGFLHYGFHPGTKKRVIAIRKSLMVLTSHRDLEKAQLKFNDTSRFELGFLYNYGSIT